MTPEQTLRAEVRETIREFEFELPLLDGIPDVQSQYSHRQVGEMVRKVIAGRDVEPATRVELLEALINAGLSPDARFGGRFINGLDPQPDGSGRTSLLMLCVREIFPQGVRLLLDRGASVIAAKEDYGYNLLEQAIAVGCVECTKLVLERATLKEFYGAKYLARDGSQAPYLLFDRASSSQPSAANNLMILRMVLEAGLGRHGLLAKAVKDGADNPDVVDVLVEHGCDLDEHHCDAVTRAAKTGKVRMLKRMLELGAEVTAKTPAGATLMQCAGKHPEVKELLRAWKTSHAVSDAIGAGADAAPSMKIPGAML